MQSFSSSEFKQFRNLVLTPTAQVAEQSEYTDQFDHSGQTLFAQLSVLISFPSQFFPSGQDRTRDREPPPHDEEQSPHASHVFHCPSRHKSEYSESWHFCVRLDGPRHLPKYYNCEIFKILGVKLPPFDILS